jgi:hypothetical protein
MAQTRVMSEIASDTWSGVVRLVGVFDANGGLLGELSYVVGKAIGRAHCGLCDITHSPWRRKPEWDRFTHALPVPFELVHRDERDAAVLAATAGQTPCVVAVMTNGQVLPLLTGADLDAASGSIVAFGDALRSRVLDLVPPHTPGQADPA